MKKNSLLLFCGFILGIITFKAIDVNASMKYNSDQVLYKKGNENITVTSALDDLYKKSISNIAFYYMMSTNTAHDSSTDKVFSNFDSYKEVGIWTTIEGNYTFKKSGNITIKILKSSMTFNIKINSQYVYQSTNTTPSITSINVDVKEGDILSVDQQYTPTGHIQNTAIVGIYN